jgi:hypothetical protein
MLRKDFVAWVAGRIPELDPGYQAAIERAGTVPFLAQVFSRLGESMLAAWS